MRNAKYLNDNSEHENISNHKRNTCVHRKATKLTKLRRYIGRRDADGPLLSDANRCAVPVHTEATTTYRTSGWLAAPPWPQTGEIDIMEDVNGLSKTSGTVRCALNELSWSLLDCTLRAAPRKALMRSAAMAHRHSASLGADHRRILEAIEDHAAGLGSRQA
jgi:hypothetical protein